MTEKLEKALQNIELIINERAAFNTGNEAKAAYQSLDLIKEELLKVVLKEEQK